MGSFVSVRSSSTGRLARDQTVLKPRRNARKKISHRKADDLLTDETRRDNKKANGGTRNVDRNGSEDETPLDSRRGQGNVRKKRISTPFFSQATGYPWFSFVSRTSPCVSGWESCIISTRILLDWKQEEKDEEEKTKRSMGAGWRRTKKKRMTRGG